MNFKCFPLFLLALQSFIHASESEELKTSKFYRKKKNLNQRIQILRDKINNQEADSSESAKYFTLLKELEKIKEKIKTSERS